VPVLNILRAANGGYALGVNTTEKESKKGHHLRANVASKIRSRIEMVLQCSDFEKKDWLGG
jgi:hypothetical protein